MQINFTISCTLEIPNQSYSAKVHRVDTPKDEDITSHFESFCLENGLLLTSEEQIRSAAYAYGKQYYA